MFSSSAIAEMEKAIRELEETLARVKAGTEQDCPICQKHKWRETMFQNSLFKATKTLPPGHHREDYDAPTTPHGAEEKAAAYASTLEAEGMTRDAAMARARAAYGLTRAVATPRGVASREFQKVAADHYSEMRPGAEGGHGVSK